MVVVDDERDGVGCAASSSTSAGTTSVTVDVPGMPSSSAGRARGPARRRRARRRPHPRTGRDRRRSRRRRTTPCRARLRADPRRDQRRLAPARARHDQGQPAGGRDGAQPVDQAGAGQGVRARRRNDQPRAQQPALWVHLRSPPFRARDDRIGADATGKAVAAARSGAVDESPVSFADAAQGAQADVRSTGRAPIAGSGAADRPGRAGPVGRPGGGRLAVGRAVRRAGRHERLRGPGRLRQPGAAQGHREPAGTTAAGAAGPRPRRPARRSAPGVMGPAGAAHAGGRRGRGPGIRARVTAARRRLPAPARGGSVPGDPHGARDDRRPAGPYPVGRGGRRRRARPVGARAGVPCARRGPRHAPDRPRRAPGAAGRGPVRARGRPGLGARRLQPDQRAPRRRPGEWGRRLDRGRAGRTGRLGRGHPADVRADPRGHRARARVAGVAGRPVAGGPRGERDSARRGGRRGRRGGRCPHDAAADMAASRGGNLAHSTRYAANPVWMHRNVRTVLAGLQL